MPYWSSDDVLLWLKKNCNNSYKLYGKLFKDHCITGRCVTCTTAALSEAATVFTLSTCVSVCAHLEKMLIGN